MLLLSERLTAAMARSPNYTQTGLARACGIKPPSVSDWLNGKTKKLEGGNLLSAAEYLAVSPWWLATGRGKMERSAAELPAPANEPPSIPDSYVDAAFIQKMIDVYVNSDAAGRDFLHRSVNDLQMAIDERRTDGRHAGRSA